MSENIWDWISKFILDLYDDDQEDLADKIRDFSSLAYDRNQEEVEAVYPELLAYARDLEHIWLEVFLRHWRLQAYLNDSFNPRPLVPEVLDLLALTQTNPAAAECPQATCVIDDLNNIYSEIDAEGFAEERYALLNEQLEILSPHKDCYMCMSVGRLEALLDMGKPREALVSWRDACRVSSAVTDTMQQGEHFHSYVSESLIRAHVMAGEWDAAQNLIDQATPKSDEHANRVALLQASVWMARGQMDKAEARILEILMGSIADVPVDQACRTITEAYAALSREAKEILAPKLLRLARLSADHGRAREAFDAAGLAAQAGLDLDKADLTGKAVEVMESAIADLNRAEEARKRIEQVRSLMGRMFRR